MQGVSSSLQALRPQGPTITPSLANHYRDDLVNHVRGWPADILEKQVSHVTIVDILLTLVFFLPVIYKIEVIDDILTFDVRLRS